MNIAVLVSGGGTNLQVLLDACREEPAARIALVASDRPGIQALERARLAGVPAHVLPDPSDAGGLIDVLRTHDISLVVLAGYLKLVPDAVVRAYWGRMVNLHPALLPSFGGAGMYGKRVHEAVLACGATVSGATVHLVSPDYDRGPIVAQWPVPVASRDTPETLAARVHAVEHRLLPAVVLAAAKAGRFVRLTADGEAFDVGEAVGSLQLASTK